MQTIPQRAKRIYLAMLKWLPVLGTFLIVIHYSGLLMFGHRSIIIDYIADTSLFSWLFLWASSRLFFCRTHRAFIWYIGAASLDVDIHRWTGMVTEPRWLFPMLFIVIGTWLLVYCSRHKIQYHECG
jgi:hypothetical protein